MWCGVGVGVGESVGVVLFGQTFCTDASSAVFPLVPPLWHQLSAECSVVCLIYVERLMENAGIEILASNWRPIMLCGLLLASKVWQDLSTWNVEFESISPDFTLKSINVLERTFLKYLRYSLFISGSVYARYYFALRSLTEKKDFRRRYNHVVMGGRPVPNSRMVEQRTEALKNQVCARSM